MSLRLLDLQGSASFRTSLGALLLALFFASGSAAAAELAGDGGLSAQEMAAGEPLDDGDEARATAATDAAGDQDPLDVTWDDLLPEGELDRLQALYEDFYESQLGDGPGAILEGGPGDSMEQIGTFSTVGELDGTVVRIPGFMVPLDFRQDRKLSRFLLVPYFGACIHTPPPPPNQIVFVTADPAVRLDSLFEPVSVEGLLRTKSAFTDTGNAAYTLALSKIAPYEY